MVSEVQFINEDRQTVIGEFEEDKVRERMKGEWIHLSEEGDICYKCGKLGPFAWLESEYLYEDNPNRCELRSNG